MSWAFTMGAVKKQVVFFLMIRGPALNVCIITNSVFASQVFIMVVQCPSFRAKWMMIFMFSCQDYFLTAVGVLSQLHTGEIDLRPRMLFYRYVLHTHTHINILYTI